MGEEDGHRYQRPSSELKNVGENGSRPRMDTHVYSHHPPTSSTTKPDDTGPSTRLLDRRVARDRRAVDKFRSSSPTTLAYQHPRDKTGPTHRPTAPPCASPATPLHCSSFAAIVHVILVLNLHVL